MDSCEEYVSSFLGYINSFVSNIRPDDPLPVRAPSYKVTETEIDGQIVDIVYHYLNHRECPPYLKSWIAHQVWVAIRNPQQNGQDGEDEDMMDFGNTTYEPMKLIQDVTRRANTLMKDLQLSLSPSQVKDMPRYLPVSHFAIKNTRRKMEDRHTIIQDLNTLYDLNYGSPHSYYGVFDGHAGTDAALYSAAHLHQYLIQNPMYEIDPVAALKHAFCFTDTNFSKKFTKERLKGGTTAVVALIREKRLVVAWLGDSQALLVRKRNPVQIVQPHKPEMTNERKRIEDAGGCVVNIQGTWRVLGQLAVSRAIGDVDYKPFVSSECDIKSLEICGDEDFLILACDGLWDTLMPEHAVNIVYSYLTKNDGDTDGVGRCLVEAARLAGSEDNITAVVVFLRPVNILMDEEATRVAQGEVPELDPILVPQKDSLPASINAIFSPPLNFIADPNPSSNIDLEAGIPLKNGGLEHGLPDQPMDTDDLFPPNIPGEVIIHDSDSDEGVGADIGMIKEERTSPLRSAVTPTEEEVDAVLAELDSLPDGACETGDIEEEEEDEGWAYYKMEPQNEMQNEDVIVGGRTEISSKPIVGEVEESSPTQPIVIQNPDLLSNTQKSPSGSPTMSGSPRTVEGFITSVELNTPEESFNTNLAINQSTEYFNGGQADQNSGPFSVYVSSSPEPASMEAPPVQSQSALHDFSGFDADFQPELKSSELSDTAESPSVEIVHAQSTVEVLATPSPVEAPSPYHEQSMMVPDIMTQSVTGDLPYEPYQPYVPSPDIALNPEAKSFVCGNYPEAVTNFYDLLTEAKEYDVYNEKMESISVDAVEHVTSFNENYSVLIDEHEIKEVTSEGHNLIEPAISEESSNLIEQLESTTNVVEQIISSPTVEGIETQFYAQDLEPMLTTEPTHDFYSQKDRFSNEITKAFDAPLDEMMMSYHEDQNPLMESTIPSYDYLHEDIKLSPVTEDILSADSQIETLTAEVSDLNIACEQESHEPIIAEVDIPCETVLESVVSIASEVIKPTTAPRTPKAAPPKPSPRSVTTKLSTAPKVAPSNETPARSATKKPVTSSAQKTLPKSNTPKPSSAPLVARSRLSASTTTTSPRASSATTRTVTTKLTTSAPSRSKSINTTTTTRTTTTVPSAAKTKSTTSTTTRTSVLAPKSRPANPTVAPNKSPAVSKPQTMTSTTSRTTTSKISNGVATKTTTTSRLSTTGVAKPPTSTVDKKLSASSITSKSTMPTTIRKPLTTTTKTTTLAMKKAPLSATSTKDSKNNTNRLLSTTKPATASLTSKTTTVRTSSLGVKAPAATKTRTVPPKTTKMIGLKAKKPEDPASQRVQAVDNSLLVNGENKIIDEETSVEVKEKVDDVDLIENMERDYAADKEAIVSAEMNQGILVNGEDH